MSLGWRLVGWLAVWKITPLLWGGGRSEKPEAGRSWRGGFSSSHFHP